MKLFGITKGDLKDIYETKEKFSEYYLNYDFMALTDRKIGRETLWKQSL